MTSDLLEENAVLRKQVVDLEQKVEIERSSRIALVNKIAELEKSCDETQELLDKQIEATLKPDKENAELKEKLNFSTQYYRGEKAKELLKQFMKFYERIARECYSKDFQKTLADTEQFISEVEK